MLLGLVNLLFFIGVVYSSLKGTFTGFGGFALGLIFLSNSAIILIVGWGALRSRFARRAMAVGGTTFDGAPGEASDELG